MNKVQLNVLINDFVRTIALNYREAGGRTPLIISIFPNEWSYYGINSLSEDKVLVAFKGMLAPEKDVEIVEVNREEAEEEIEKIFHKVEAKDE